VSIVVVSHSAQIASGTVALARQMAPDVSLEAAGGAGDDELGTSFDRVDSAVRRVGGSVVVLCDLGSAVMTAETVVELLDESARPNVRIADAPIVEGTIAAAVAAQTGGGLQAVIAAAEAACGTRQQTSAASGSGVPGRSPGENANGAAAVSPRYAKTTTLVNDDGLHARPAAEFVRLAASFPTKVTVNGKDAKSLLGIMSLGLMKGATVEIEAESEGAAAVDALVALIDSGFATKRDA